MKSFLTIIARKIWPDFDSLAEPDRHYMLRELFSTLFGLPFVALALIWLLAETDWNLLREQWMVLLLILAFNVLAGRLSFFQITVSKEGNYNYNGSSLEIVIGMSAMLIFGPTAVWVPFLGRLIAYAIDRPRSTSRYLHWNGIRNLVYNLGAAIVGLLLMLAIYEWLGGSYPLAEMTLATAWPAFVAVLFWLPWEGLYLVITGFLLTRFQLESRIQQEEGLGFDRQMFIFFLAAQSAAFFGILAAVTYVQIGMLAYIYFMGGVLLASLLARRLSQQAMVSQQRSRELTQLEQLGRALLAAPVDASTLPQLLAVHVPRMFGFYQVEIRLYTGLTLLQLPEDRPSMSHEVWEWSAANPETHQFAPGETPLWTNQATTHPLYLNPILAVEKAEPLGSIIVAQDRLYFEKTLMDLGPALRVLADQIATALHQAEIQAQTLAHQRTVQELDFAWQIQESFLPDTLPEIEGWQLAAALKPCKETSGDFYDVISLPNGNLGFHIADVADKGMGAALFMALCRTLLRTYAFEHQSDPGLVLQSTNERILTDTHNNMFVTVFYGILDPGSGRLTYANAGHNPPYLFKTDSAEESSNPQGLRNTGMPLGILEEARWEAKTVELDHGDTLVMYTDGVTEAQSLQEEFFDDARLLATIRKNLHGSALDIQKSVMAAVEQFSDVGEQCDDETLLIIRRGHFPRN